MTKAEIEYQAAVRALGCLVCLMQGHPGTPASIHHCLSGGRKMGEMFVLPLCPAHHQGGVGSGRFISRHPWAKRFRDTYGTESELMKTTRKMVKAAA